MGCKLRSIDIDNEKLENTKALRKLLNGNGGNYNNNLKRVL
jgi:hypothetical protein